jgi:hypothetical protein
MKNALCPIECDYLRVKYKNGNSYDWRFVCKKHNCVLKLKKGEIIKMCVRKEAQ